MKSLRQRVCVSKAVKKQADKRDIKDTIWHLIIRIGLEEYPKHCANCPHRENCAHLKVHDSCYVVDVTIERETVKYQMMECDCDGIQETAERPAGIKETASFFRT